MSTYLVSWTEFYSYEVQATDADEACHRMEDLRENGNITDYDVFDDASDYTVVKL